MKHLGDQVAALVDGELDHDARDRALAHLAHCARCRLEVGEHRRLKQRLSRLDAAEPPADLAVALHRALERQAWSPGPNSGSGAGLGGVAGRARLPHVRVSRRRAGLVLAGAGSACAALLGSAYVVGGPTAEGPPVSPPVGQFSAEFADTTQGMPFSDPAAGVVPASVRDEPSLGVAGP